MFVWFGFKRTYTCTLFNDKLPSLSAGVGVVMILRTAITTATTEATVVKKPKTFCRRVKALCIFNTQSVPVVEIQSIRGQVKDGQRATLLRVQFNAKNLRSFIVANSRTCSKWLKLPKRTNALSRLFATLVSTLFEILYHEEYLQICKSTSYTRLQSILSHISIPKVLDPVLI